MTYVKVNGNLYPATINGTMEDRAWDNRESKAITLDGAFSEVDALFPDGTVWSIVTEEAISVFDENGVESEEIQQTEYDNSEFSIRGDLTVHGDGTCTVKMGKITDAELLAIIMGGN